MGGVQSARCPKAFAWLAHALTLSGVLWACLALIAVFEGETNSMWIFLGIALVVDGVDGWFARRTDVTTHAPGFDGVALDLIVDYLTWSFIPAFFLYSTGLLGGGPSAVALFVLICGSSMFCYCNTGMKTHDYYFMGFPAAWNIVAVMLWILQTPVVMNAVIVVIFAALTLAPIAFVHPFRVRRLMPINIGMTAVWIVTTGYLVAVRPDHPWTVATLWWVSGTWFVGVGIWRTLRTRRSGKLQEQASALV